MYVCIYLHLCDGNSISGLVFNVNLFNDFDQNEVIFVWTYKENPTAAMKAIRTFTDYTLFAILQYILKITVAKASNL